MVLTAATMFVSDLRSHIVSSVPEPSLHQTP
jgi:hypothetical protein